MIATFPTIITQKLQHLSPSRLYEIDRFLDFMIQKDELSKNKTTVNKKPSWYGCLKNKIKLSSVELQKQSLNWRK
jgi:hypothetical protein